MNVNRSTISLPVLRRSSRPALRVFCAAALVSLAAACVHAGAGPEETRRKQERGAFDESSAETIKAALTLGPNDVFQVDVYREKDLSGLYRVDVKGSIQFPLVGDVSATGKTAAELAEELRARLSQYLRDPYVSVFVKEFNSKKVYVFGEVQKPGTFAFEDGMNIVQAITLAGGFTAKASRNASSVTRRINGKETRYEVRVEDIARGAERNLRLMPGDIAFVPEAFF